MDRETRFIPTDIESIVCWRCREKARLIRREPLPANIVGEILIFKCENCVIGQFKFRDKPGYQAEIRFEYQKPSPGCC